MYSLSIYSIDVKNIMGQTETAFCKMRNILCHNSQSVEVRKRMLACYIEQILTSGYKPENLVNKYTNILKAQKGGFIEDC